MPETSNINSRPARPEYQQRVITEEHELADRRDKLAEFINGSPLFPSLPEQERKRLYQQLSIMNEYARVLQDRIAAFDLSSSPV
jgi:hypothetical protein